MYEVLVYMVRPIISDLSIDTGQTLTISKTAGGVKVLLRLGYVADATRLVEASPSRMITATNYVKLPEKERSYKLQRNAS